MSPDEALFMTVGFLTMVMGMVASRTDFTEDYLSGSRRELLRKWTVGTSPDVYALSSGFFGAGLFLAPGPFAEIPRAVPLTEAMSLLGFLQWLVVVDRTS